MANRSRSGLVASFAATLALACGVGACAASARHEPAVAPNEKGGKAMAGAGSAVNEQQAKFEACYATSPKAPNLSIDTQALYFARQGKYVFVDVSLPATPELEACVRRAILTSPPFLPPNADAQALISGSIAVRLGPPPLQPAVRPSIGEVRQRLRRITLEAWKQGALRADDAPVRELLSPAPRWPNPEQRAELQACYAAARGAFGGAPMHRDVIYLSRAGRILLADVRVPESTELEQCLLERIRSWPAPFSVPGETVLSSFFIHLGTDHEEYPSGPSDLKTELARRDALVTRAVQLGLVSAEDPLMTKLKVGRSQ